MEVEAAAEEVAAMEGELVAKPTVASPEPVAASPAAFPEPAAVSPPASPAPVDYGSLKVTELRSLCEERGLENKGVKADLIKRLSEGAAASPKRSIDEVEDAAAAEPATKKIAAPAFGTMKVAELRSECEARGLGTKGVKAVLVKVSASDSRVWEGRERM